MSICNHTYSLLSWLKLVFTPSIFCANHSFVLSATVLFERQAIGVESEGKIPIMPLLVWTRLSEVIHAWPKDLRLSIWGDTQVCMDGQASTRSFTKWRNFRLSLFVGDFGKACHWGLPSRISDGNREFHIGLFWFVLSWGLCMVGKGEVFTLVLHSLDSELKYSHTRSWFRSCYPDISVSCETKNLWPLCLPKSNQS